MRNKGTPTKIKAKKGKRRFQHVVRYFSEYHNKIKIHIIQSRKLCMVGASMYLRCANFLLTQCAVYFYFICFRNLVQKSLLITIFLYIVLMFLCTIRNILYEAGEMGQWLREYWLILQMIWVWRYYLHDRLTAAYDSSTMTFRALSWLLRVLHSCGTQTYTQANHSNTHIYFKMSFRKKEIN